MKKRIIYLILLIITNGIAYGNIATDSEKLYTKVIEKLKFEPKLDASEITIGIKGNADIVVLGGTVKNYIEKIIAENAIRSINGVRIIVDEMKVDSTEWKRKKTDIDLAEEANNILKWSVLVPYEKIKLIVENGIISLTGRVEWQFQKLYAEKAVSNLWGVKSVINNIIVEPLIPINANEVRSQIIKEFERHARIDVGKMDIIVEGRKIILKGKVHNLDEMDEAVNAAWSIPGVAEVQNELVISK